MSSNNIGDAKIEEDQIEVSKILNGHENIDPNIFFKIKTGKKNYRARFHLSERAE